MTQAAAGSARAAIAGQALRYGASGALLAALYSTVFALLATHGGLHPQLANAIAFAVNLVAGWALHSRWSFRGHGLGTASRGRVRTARLAYAAGNLAAYALNAFWVWLVVGRLGLPVLWSIVPIVTLTPAFTFLLNRKLVFQFRT
ncbi:MAG: GtrA family protein [Sphingomonadales bacterium]|nr:GtrA family protein [Sphingomonadales bacterium]